MENKAVAFSQAFPQGILHIDQSNLKADEKELLKFLLTDIRRDIQEGILGDFLPGAKEVYIDYINSSSHNAQANYFGFKAVGINYGLVLNVYKIACILVGCKEVFEDFDEDDELYTLAELKPLFAQSFEAPNALHSRSKPLSEKRAMIAALIMKTAFYFIVAHELCHVLKHGVILKTERQSGIISEFYDATLFDSTNILDMKALEMDADRNGALSSFWFACQLGVEDGLLDQNDVSYTYVWILAVFALLYSFEQSSKFYYPNKKGYHPPVYIRQIFCLQFIRMSLADDSAKQFFAKNAKAEFNTMLIHNFPTVEEFMGMLGVDRNPQMEAEYKILVEHLRKLSAKYY